MKGQIQMRTLIPNELMDLMKLNHEERASFIAGIAFFNFSHRTDPKPRPEGYREPSMPKAFTDSSWAHLVFHKMKP